MRKGTGGDARRPLFSLLCTRWFMVWPRAETGSHIDAKGYRQAHTLPAPLSAVQVLAGDAAAAVFSMANSNHVIRHCTLEQQCRCICNVRATSLLERFPLAQQQLPNIARQHRFTPIE